MPYLILYPGSGSKAQLVQLVRPVTTLGSSREADVPLDDDGLAGLHAVTEAAGGKYSLSLLQGREAFLHNGAKVKKCGLSDGDFIFLGRTGLRFLTLAPQQPPADQGLWFRKLHEFTLQLAEKNTPDELLEDLLGRLIELCEADSGFVFIQDGGEQTLHISRNMQTLDPGRNPFSNSVLNRVMAEGTGLLLEDASGASDFSAAASVVDFHLRSVLCVPLMFRAQPLGAIYLGNSRRPGAFDRQKLEMAEVFAAHAAGLVKNAFVLNELRREKASLEQKLEEIRFGRVIGSSQAMRELYAMVERIAPTELNVLLYGETGTGKELFSREIHERSRRAKGPLIAINCGAIPESLFESELFGHVRGAFTGAIQNKKGCFQEAAGGTLFLDEIGELPLSLQPKLLRAIEERKVFRVGASAPEPVDIRLIAASNKDLAEEVSRGRFREDLYYRLKVIGVRIPPLRERGEDIVLIANYLLRKAATRENRPLPKFSADAVAVMRLYSWPGNIREMENRINKALVMSEGPEVRTADLELHREEPPSLKEASRRFTLDYIQRILEKTGGNKAEAARILGMDPRTLFRYLEEARGVEELDRA